MKLGVIVPQGWTGEFDGWDPRAAWDRTVDVARQADEIDALRERYPRLTILHGCEVDILPNGQLDFPDRILERFDIVLASLHDRAGDSPERLMERYAGAMKHPLVAMLTGGVNAADWKWVLKPAQLDAAGRQVAAEVAIRYGLVLQTALDVHPDAWLPPLASKPRASSSAAPASFSESR